jgi:hypothetical protein
MYVYRHRERVRERERESEREKARETRAIRERWEVMCPTSVSA